MSCILHVLNFLLVTHHLQAAPAKLNWEHYFKDTKEYDNINYSDPVGTHDCALLLTSPDLLVLNSKREHQPWQVNLEKSVLFGISASDSSPSSEWRWQIDLRDQRILSTRQTSTGDLWALIYNAAGHSLVAIDPNSGAQKSVSKVDFKKYGFKYAYNPEIVTYDRTEMINVVFNESWDKVALIRFDSVTGEEKQFLSMPEEIGVGFRPLIARDGTIFTPGRKDPSIKARRTDAFYVLSPSGAVLKKIEDPFIDIKQVEMDEEGNIYLSDHRGLIEVKADGSGRDKLHLYYTYSLNRGGEIRWKVDGSLIGVGKSLVYAYDIVTGKISALHKSDGRVAWEYDAFPRFLRSYTEGQFSILEVDDLLYLTSYGHKPERRTLSAPNSGLHILFSETGKEHWSYELPRYKVASRIIGVSRKDVFVKVQAAEGTGVMSIAKPTE